MISRRNLLFGLAGTVGYPVSDTGSLKVANRMSKPELSASGQVSGSRLQIAYSVMNGTSDVLYLFDGVYQSDKRQIDQNTCNVEFLDGFAWVSKKIIRPPENCDFERLNIPLSSRLLPGQKVTATIQAELPLRVWTPYSHVLPETGAVQRARAVFEIGYYLFSSGQPRNARAVDISGKVYVNFDPFPIDRQQTTSMALLPIVDIIT